MNFIREKETQYILIKVLLKYNCAYIFNSLPLDLQKILNDLSGEAVKATIKAYDEEIKGRRD